MPSEPSPLDPALTLVSVPLVSFLEPCKFALVVDDGVSVFTTDFPAAFCPLVLSFFTLTSEVSCALFCSLPMLKLLDVFCFLWAGCVVSKGSCRIMWIKDKQKNILILKYYILLIIFNQWHNL